MDSIEKAEVLRELRKQRTSRQMTLEDYAKQMGISTSRLWQIENTNPESIRWDTIIKIAKEVGLEIEIKRAI